MALTMGIEPVFFLIIHQENSPIDIRIAQSGGGNFSIKISLSMISKHRW